MPRGTPARTREGAGAIARRRGRAYPGGGGGVARAARRGVPGGRRASKPGGGGGGAASAGGWGGAPAWSWAGPGSGAGTGSGSDGGGLGSCAHGGPAAAATASELAGAPPHVAGPTPVGHVGHTKSMSSSTRARQSSARGRRTRVHDPGSQRQRSPTSAAVSSGQPERRRSAPSFHGRRRRARPGARPSMPDRLRAHGLPHVDVRVPEHEHVPRVGARRTSSAMRVSLRPGDQVVDAAPRGGARARGANARASAGSSSTPPQLLHDDALEHAGRRPRPSRPAPRRGRPSTQIRDAAGDTGAQPRAPRANPTRCGARRQAAARGGRSDQRHRATRPAGRRPGRSGNGPAALRDGPPGPPPSPSAAPVPAHDRAAPAAWTRTPRPAPSRPPATSSAPRRGGGSCGTSRAVAIAPRAVLRSRSGRRRQATELAPAGPVPGAASSGARRRRRVI